MSRYENVWRILTMHCDEASRLSSESLDHDLTAADSLACRLHLLICGSCRRHRRDILALRRLARRNSESVEHPTAALSDEVRERIKQSLHGDGPTV